MTAGYEPRWDIDAEYGEQGENTVRHLLDLGYIEVKRKSRIDDQFYVELSHSPRATGDYKASGLATTEAQYWGYTIGHTGVVVFVPTDRLKRAAAQGRSVACTEGDNPTRGVLVSFRDVLLS